MQEALWKIFRKTLQKILQEGKKVKKIETVKLVQIETEAEKTEIAGDILEDLPEWFGLPESTAEYIKECVTMPFWAALSDGEAAGFIALKETSPHTAEIYVMGVKKAFHGSGIGKLLFQSFYAYAKEHGYSFLQVKTVQRGHYAEYDRTGEFYRKMGFLEFECMKTLWDAWNPCQIYVMAISE